MKVMRVGSPVPGPPLTSPAARIGVYGGLELAGRTEATSKLSGVGVWAWQSPTTIRAAKVINQNRATIIPEISVLAPDVRPVYAQAPSDQTTFSYNDGRGGELGGQVDENVTFTSSTCGRNRLRLHYERLSIHEDDEP